MKKTIKNVSLFFLAPFIGLAYIIALPFVGFGAAVYFGLLAWEKKQAEKADGVLVTE